MKRNASFLLAALSLAICHFGGARAGEYYCPPGAKFCPAPGLDDSAAAAGAFGLESPSDFGLPASAGGGYMAAAPYQAAPAANPPSYQPPAPQAYQHPYPEAGAPGVVRSSPQPNRTGFIAVPRTAVPRSEVANETSRKSRRERTDNDEKVPWYKGGLWRNRKKDDDREDRSRKNSSSSRSDSSTSSSRSNSGSDSRNADAGRSAPAAGASGRSARALDDDSMWEDDEEYTGYNSDGSFGRPAAAADRQPPRRDPPPQRQPTGDPFNDPFAPYGGDQGGGFAGGGGYGPPPAPAPAPVQQAQAYDAPIPYDPFPIQSPPPDPYLTQPPRQDDLGTASFLSEPYASSSYSQPAPYPDYGTAGYTSAPDYGGAYSASPGGMDMSSYDFPSGGYQSGGGSWQGGGDPWSAPPPPPQSPYQGAPSLDAQGSPQFENAVRMVKENRFSEAKNILASETSRNPSNAAAWRWLADCHYNLLELDDALSCYQHALERDPNDYYALRGQGFAYLHRGHEYWRRMQDEVSRNQKEQAAATFAQAHENYKNSLESLGRCLRRAPNDGEAVYGEAMAAEGASRKLYSNAISYLKLGPEQRERAELFAENCITVINKGVERAQERAKQNPGDAGPRALLGGLYLRKAILYHQLGKTDLALTELVNSRKAQESILKEIDKNHPTAQKNLREVESYWAQWGGNRN